MNKKYICPKHKDTNPSAHAYSDHYFCFVCHARGPITELGLEPGEKVEYTYVEDLQATLGYIRDLPKKTIRGFSLPFSSRGYFLVWPDQSYYKLRIEGAADGQKYRGPAGHKKPWMLCRQGDSGQVALVEGEFNALSLALVCPTLTVISPGGAGDFYSKGSEKALQKLTLYDKVYVVTDDDAAGSVAAIQATSKLKHFGVKDVKICLMSTDANEIHTSQGTEALKTEARKMGMPTGDV